MYYFRLKAFYVEYIIPSAALFKFKSSYIKDIVAAVPNLASAAGWLTISLLL